MARHSFARESKSSWHLRTYFALLLASFVVVAAVAFFYVMKQTDRDARTSAEHDARAAADTSAQQLGGGLALLNSAVASLTGNPQIPQVMANPGACTLSFSWLTSGHLDLIRTDGTVVCSSRTAKGRSGLYAGQSWLSRALAGPVLIGPVRDPATGKESVVAAAPLPEGAGVAAAFGELAPLGPKLLALYGGGKPILLTVADEASKRVVARSIDPARWIGSSVVDTAFDTTTGQGTVEQKDLPGTTRLFEQSEVPGFGWRIYAGEDKAVALAAGKRLERRQFAIILIGLTLTLLAALLIYRRVAMPLARLAEAVRSVNGHTGPKQMPTSGPAEVRALGEDVNGLIESLTSSELSYQHLFDRHPAAMWLFDTGTLAFLAVNDAAVEMYGYSRQEFLAMTIEEIRPPEDRDELRLAVTDRDRKDVDAAVWRHLKKDGTLVEVEISSNAVEFEGHPARAVLARDVTERRRLEEQLRQAQKMEAIGRLAGGIAHDFNNLLLVIRGYGATLLDGLTDEKLRRSALQIDSAAQRAADFTHQLLAFSRQQVLRPALIDPNEVVDETVSLVRRMLSEDIELVVELEPKLGAIVVDRGQLGQVMLNLLVNAREAMSHGGSLVVGTANVELGDNYAAEHVGVAPGPYVMLQVTDSGAGMDAETRSRIFDPFFTTKNGGTGLGLATVQGIVVQSGGHIWVYSEPGLGTSFKIYFPAAAISAAPAPEKLDAGSPQGDETILLVEDAELVRELVSEALESFGYNVLVASNGVDALELAKHHNGDIDLLLTDVVMPNMNGRELAERMLLQDSDLKVLFTSGYPSDTILRNGIVGETAAFIEKPYLPVALAQKVRTVLRS